MPFDLHKALLLICAVLLFAVPACAREYKAVVLKTGLPGEDGGLVANIGAELTAAGYTVNTISLAGLCDAANLDASTLDLLVLPDSSALPAKSAETIQAFLRGGGDIIALNTPMWRKSLINVGGDWVSRDDYQTSHAGVLPDHILLDFAGTEIKGWNRGTNDDTSKTVHELVADGPAPGQRSLHVDISNLTSWETFSSPKTKQPFRDGETLTVFSAKGGPTTTQVSIEWDEKDGSRWIAVVALTPEWRKYVLRPEDFQYWISTPGRGGRGDHFKPENADAMGVGLSMTHTPSVGGGKHEYWIGPFGTAKVNPEYQEILQAIDPPALDTLSPSYKLFDMHDVASLGVRSDQVIVGQEKLSLPSVLRSPQPRPKGGGFNKGRDWRWIPLIEGRSADGTWRGTPATLLVNASGPYKGGVWASFGIGDIEWYKTPAAQKMIREIAERMKTPVWLVDGGTNYYTYFDKQPITAGVRAISFEGEHKLTEKVMLDVHNNSTGISERPVAWNMTLKPGGIVSKSARLTDAAFPESGYDVTAELVQDGKVIDRVTHETYVWKPKAVKHFVTVKNGDFMLDGKRWRAEGVNFMPSSGIGTEDGEYFEHYLSARSYDPEVFQRDIGHLKDLGFNAVSIFVYAGVEKDQNLLDLLRRLDLAGIKADLALRPGTPFDFQWPGVGDIVKNSRLAENDTIFAYDLAWEPMFGHQRDRVIWDGEWEKWIIERYGSVENAEADWEFAVPRDANGKVTNPTPVQVDNSGPSNAMVAAYRRFLDTLLYKKYGEARRLVRSVDPNHMVSFRMAEAVNPTYHWEGRISYDWPYLAGAVDILSPEAYGRIGDWEAVKPGWFQFEWGRLYGHGMPFMWKEMGVSAWDLSRMQDSDARLQYQAMFYSNFYRLLISAGMDGVFHWWYPGGFRYGENSDYGIINPDGTDRAVTKVIREKAPEFLNGPPAKTPNYWITVDRDAYPDGISGVYDKVKDQFWKAIEQGLTPGLRTTGTGTDSSNCPLIAVGNTQCNGVNPPKYLDAAIDAVEIQNSKGKWVAVEKGGSVKVNRRRLVMARIEFTNLGEAKLLASGNDNKIGAVYIAVMDGTSERRAVLPQEVPHLRSLEVKDIVLAPEGLSNSKQLVITFDANARTRFGEKFGLTLIPE